MSLPEPNEVLAYLYGRDLLHGQVTDLTDSGGASEAFAVIYVKELACNVVVATKHLQEVSGTVDLTRVNERLLA